jgi:PTS system arbutin-like IIC component
MFHNHASMMFTQIGIGVCFTGIYFVVFKTLIERLNLKTPGREESEIKLYSKADYQAARGQTTAPAAASQQVGQAAGFLQALGGAGQYRKHEQLRHPLTYRAGGYGANPKRRRL